MPDIIKLSAVKVLFLLGVVHGIMKTFTGSKNEELSRSRGDVQSWIWEGKGMKHSAKQ
jgi:hypothetical protein